MNILPPTNLTRSSISGVPCSFLHDAPFLSECPLSSFPCPHSYSCPKIHSEQDFYRQLFHEPSRRSVHPAYPPFTNSAVCRPGTDHTTVIIAPVWVSHCIETPLKKYLTHCCNLGIENKVLLGSQLKGPWIWELTQLWVPRRDIT